MIDFAHLVRETLAASILLLVVGLGMQATFAQATSLFRDLFRPPYSLMRAVMAMNFVVPIVAATIARSFSLAPEVKIAIVVMAVSPVPPILPVSQLRFGGRVGYVYGLLVAVSLSAIMFVPLTIELLGRILDRDIHMSFVEMAKVIAKTILVPLGFGLAIRAFVPRLAERLAPPVLRLGNIMLILGLLPLLAGSASSMWHLIGNGTIVAILTVVMVAMVAGHRIGGPDEHDRTALAIVSAMRHPGVALAIAKTNFPHHDLVPAAILLFVLVAAITTTIYGTLRHRHLSSHGGGGLAARA